MNAVGKTTISATYTTTGPNDKYKTTKVSYELTVTNLVPQSNKFWKFADYKTGDVATTTTTDNLEIVATSSKKVTIAEEERTINSVGFTKKLQLNGTSDGDYRYIHFVVEPNKKIYVYHKAGGSSRKLKIDLNSKGGTNLLNKDASTTGDVYSTIYTGTENAEIFIYSGNSGIDIFGIKVTPAHTVTYALNGGTGTLPTESKKGTGDKFNLHNGTTDITAPDGKEFDGWSDGTSTYAGGAEYTMPDDDVILTAQWKSAETKYTVTYDVNGGGSCATASATQPTVGAALTLPNPTWDGYTLDGWYNAGIKIGDAGAEYTPKANITLYAKWTDNTEGKLFSYVDGNYGDMFQAYDGSGWVTADTNNKNKTFGTTGAPQYIITKGTWEKKNNSISALAKFIYGTTEMSIVIPSGYAATVKILS